MRFYKWVRPVAAFVLMAFLAGCGSGSAASTKGKLNVAATVGMIGDVVKNIGGEHVEVTALMGPGVDPHLYKPSAGDIAKLQAAQIIFYNGLNLEGRMGDILVKMARTKPTIPVSERIPQELILDDGQGHEDPHIWFDVALWMKAVEVVRDSLIEADPAHKADFQRNAAAYLKELEELHQYALQQLTQIPKERRVLVTAHDAFSYFGRAYDIEVEGLQGISTEAEYGLADVQRIVKLLVDRQVKAVFVESSVPKRAIEAVVEGARARGHSVVVGAELYSDAMGQAGTPEGTYIGMVRHNVDAIVKALR